MKSSRKILVSLLSVALAVNGLGAAQSEQKNRAPELTQAVTPDTVIPKSVQCFVKMDFDSRRVYQEYLRLKHGDALFLDTMRRTLLPKNTDIETVMTAMEIATLGRTVDSLYNVPMREVAEKCGLNRVCALMDFKKKNKTGYFLDGKNEFDRCALAAEMMAFEEAARLFEVDEWVGLKRMVMFEDWRYNDTHCSDMNRGNAYAKSIMMRAQNRLQQERQVGLNR